MTTVGSTSGVGAAAAATTPSATQSGSGPTLGMNDFLTLMVGELKNQNPLNPSSQDPSQSLAQIAQFTMLEQITNLAQSSEQSAKGQQLSQGVSLIGHTVSYTAADGSTQSGIVQSVQTGGSGPTLTVGGTAGIDPTTVNQVS
jgi:flagellar basal-body rod modification protein FlgD